MNCRDGRLAREGELVIPVFLLLCGCLLNLAGCGNGSKPVSSEVRATVIAQVDPESGGVVGHEDGVQLAVPVGAFPGSVDITVRTVEPSHVPLTATENIRVAPTFEIEAANGGVVAQPERPVTLRLPYDPALMPPEFAEEDLVAVFWDGEGWVDIASRVDVDRHLVETTPEHLSMWTVEARDPRFEATLDIRNADLLRSGDPVHVRLNARSLNGGQAPFVELLVTVRYHDRETGQIRVSEAKLPLTEAGEEEANHLDIFRDPTSLGDRVVTVYERDRQGGDGAYDLVVESDEVDLDVASVAISARVGSGLSKLETAAARLDFPLPLRPNADISIRRLRMTDLEGRGLTGTGLEEGQEVLVQVGYANLGQNPVLDARLELLQNGARAQEVGLLLPAESSGSHTFRLRLQEGRQRLEATIGSAGQVVDTNPADNQMGIEVLTEPALHRLSGRLVEEGGVGLAGVRLTLSGGGSLQAIADANGHFAFRGLRNGPYTLFPSHPEHEIPPVSIEINGKDLDLTPILVGSPRYSISGRVHDETGGAVGEITVRLSGEAAVETRTDAFGLYRFENLLSGSYGVIPSSTGFEVSPTRANVTLTGAFSGIDFQAIALVQPVAEVGTLQTSGVDNGVPDDDESVAEVEPSPSADPAPATEALAGGAEGGDPTGTVQTAEPGTESDQVGDGVDSNDEAIGDPAPSDDAAAVVTEAIPTVEQPTAEGSTGEPVDGSSVDAATVLTARPDRVEGILIDLPGGAKMEMVYVEPGSFTMGSPDSEPGRSEDEGPRHTVEISEGFHLGRFEITRREWDAVMGQVSAPEEGELPVVSVSWNEVEEFVARVNQYHGEDRFRLPTEAEWEYAARAGAASAYAFGDQVDRLGDFAWYRDAGPGEAVALAGAKEPNAWGLFDMHGNAWEWVQDWYASDFYAVSESVDPIGPASGSDRVIRGGDFRGDSNDQRSARRFSIPPSSRFDVVGARLLMGRPIEQTIPRLTTSPGQVVVGSQERQFDLLLNNQGSGVLEWVVHEEEPWMEISSALGSTATDGTLSGVGAAILQVHLYRPGGNDEELRGKIEVSSNGGTAEIPVWVEPTVRLGNEIIQFEESLQVLLPRGATMDFVWIEPGSFAMGATAGEGGFPNEGPRHVVEFGHGFYLGRYEVTQEQWEAVQGSRPWNTEGGVDYGPDAPATFVNWIDVQSFIHQLNQELGETVYRLPTEAEWEYAARAGTTTPWLVSEEELPDYAWFDASVNSPQPVGAKLPNQWGLYDMHGNVWEWVQDWYGEDYYTVSPVFDPSGPEAGAKRVMRGGDFRIAAGGLRSARRFNASPSVPRVSIFGFRIVLDRAIPQPHVTPEQISVFSRPMQSALELRNIGSGQLEWTISEQASWLVVSSGGDDSEATGSLSGRGDADFTVHTSGVGLPEGEWREEIQISTNGGNLSVGVNMRVRDLLVVPLPGGATMTFVWVEPGLFQMGSPVEELGRYTDEGPVREVEIREGFYLGRYEITQGQWESVMKTTPWVDQDLVEAGPDKPATYISWDDVQALVTELNDLEGETLYRLPTEAEWEFAARAGSQEPWSFGGDHADLDEYAWHQSNAFNLDRNVPSVGRRLPNQWEFYDMHGNVWEWVADYYQANYYEDGEGIDPQGPEEGEFRVIRGGAFFDLTRDLRSARRAGYLTERGFGPGVGARLVRIR